jgi:hypothetical protein
LGSSYCGRKSAKFCRYRLDTNFGRTGIVHDAAFVYVPVCHGIWSNGWLEQLGVMDFAGGIAVHRSAGIAALVGAIIAGPLRYRWTVDNQGNIQPTSDRAEKLCAAD